MGRAEVLRQIFTVNLKAKKNENVLVFTDILNGEKVTEADRQRREKLRSIAREVTEAGKGICETLYLEFPSGGSHGKEPPIEVWEAAFGKTAISELGNKGLMEKLLAKKAGHEELAQAETIIDEYSRTPDAIIALSNYSTSHTRFRDFLTRVKGARYASMPLFEESMLDGVMTADWNRVEERTLRLVEMIEGGQSVSIATPNGTSITFSIKDRPVMADTGILESPGAFGNLPAGEAFLAPVEGTAEGILILEWAPTKRLINPVSLIVEKGHVVKVEGHGEFAEDLMEKLSAHRLAGNIAELGIGTNDRAQKPDNILETEKILGTVHIALGDNSSFGGKVSVPFHQDFIFFNPTMEVFKGDEEIVQVLVRGEPQF